MNKEQALNLLKDLNQLIDEEIDEDNFLIILKNYVDVKSSDMERRTGTYYKCGKCGFQTTIFNEKCPVCRAKERTDNLMKNYTTKIKELQ